MVIVKGQERDQLFVRLMKLLSSLKFFCSTALTSTGWVWMTITSRQCRPS